MPATAPPPLDDDLATVAARLRECTVEVRATLDGRATGHGSGIVWDADGLVVTNAHVARTPEATITLPDGRSIHARPVARDPRRDLATLRLVPPPPGLTPAPLGDPDSLRPGHLLLALGHPLGVPNSLAVGVVHSAIATATGNHGAIGGRLIAADIRLAPGNSGGPLADAAGRVVGVNSMVAGGLGIAIPTTTVARFVAAHTRPRLGVALRPVAVALRGRPRTIVAGLLVLELTPGAPAARAGLLPGDVLLGAAGTPFRSGDDLAATLRHAPPGTTILLDVGRAGRRTAVAVALPPASDPERPRRAA